jgi:hypothetical protein
MEKHHAEGTGYPTEGSATEVRRAWVAARSRGMHA